MIIHWTKFEGTPNARRQETARVTLQRNSTFQLNRIACEAIGTPVAVELMFDENQRKIGIAPVDPKRRNAFPLRETKNSKYRWVAAGAFLTHFAIKAESTVLFEDVTLENDILILDMTKTTRVGRGAR